MRGPISKHDLVSQIERLKRRLRGSVTPKSDSEAQAPRPSYSSSPPSPEPPVQQQEQRGAFTDTAAAFHALVEGIREGAAILAQDRTVLTCNRRLAEMLKLECEAVMGHSMLEFISPDDQPSFEELLQSTSEEFQKFHLHLSGANAFPLPVEFAVKRLTASGRRVYSLLATDLSRRRRAEEQLAFQAHVLANVSDAVIALDEHFRITHWNPAAERLYGWTADEVLGRTFSEVIQPDLLPAEKDELRRQLTERGEFNNQAWHRRRDGTSIWVEARRIALHAPDGRMLGYVSLNRDITERKRSEEHTRTHVDQLQQRSEELRRYSDQMKRFARQMSEIAEERRRHGAVLEQRVAERTAELEAANRELKKEIAERQSEILAREQTAAKLREVLQSLEDTMLAARESEELLRIANEAAGMVAWTYDPEKDQVVTFARTSDWLQVVGEKSFPLFGRGLETVHPDDRDKVTRALPRVLAGEPLNIELRLLLSDGAVRWIATQGRLLTRPSAKPLLVGVTQDVTERRRVQAHLQKLNSELNLRTRQVEAERARWQGVVEGIADEVWVADLQGKMSLINLPDVTGMGLEAFTAKTVAEIYEEVDILNPDGQIRPLEDAPLLRSLKGEIVRGEEMMRHRQTGKTRYRQFSSAPTRDAAGNITGAVAIVHDITEHKQLQQALEQASQRVHEILESIQDGFFALDRDWRFTYVNQRAANNVGAAPEALVGQNLWETFPALLGTPLEEQYRTAMGQRVPVRFDTNDVMTDTIYEVRVYPSAEGISVYWIDITERKRAETTLRKRETTLVQAGRMAQVGAWDVEFHNLEDWDANPLTWSEEVYRIFGYAPGAVEATNARFFERVHPDDRPRIREAVAQARATRQPYSIEHRIVRPNGEERIVHEHAEFFFDERGQPIRLVGAVQDITDRKQAEKNIRQLNRDLEQRAAELEAANKELESFSYSVSHDLRTPLAAILGFARTALADYAGQLPADVDHQLRFILANAENMEQLIQALLALSRAGRQPLKKERVNVRALVEEVWQDLAPQREGRKVEIQVGALPDAEADPLLLRQVLVNLLANALKFTRPRPVAHIEVDSYRNNGDTVYVVKDNGVGFDPNQTDKLFRVFQRLHSEDEFEGSGLGLALVQQIVRRHGGYVCADAVPDQGAAFYVTLAGREQSAAA